MRTTSSLTFICRKSKSNKNGLAPLEASIIINGERKFIALTRKEDPKTFKRKVEQRKGNDLKDYLEEIRARFNEYQTELLRNGMEITSENLKNAFQNGGIKRYSTNDLFKDYLSILKKRIGTDLTKGVYRKYELVWELFKKYVDGNKGPETITNQTIQNFHTDLKARYDNSTTAGYMTKLKAFIRFGMDNDRIRINPFQGIKVQRGQKEITYLTEEQIMAIKDYELDNKSLEQVRDCFIVMCGTGMAYADLKEFRKEDLIESNGVWYIQKRRIKTGSEYISVVMPWAKEIIDRYEKLPVISNQKINTYLHCIEDQMKLPIKLHCHLARHSYATFLLNKGVKLETVSKTLGHKNTKITTQFYVKFLPDTITKEVASIIK